MCTESEADFWRYHICTDLQESLYIPVPKPIVTLFKRKNQAAFWNFYVPAKMNSWSCRSHSSLICDEYQKLPAKDFVLPCKWAYLDDSNYAPNYLHEFQFWFRLLWILMNFDPQCRKVVLNWKTRIGCGDCWSLLDKPVFINGCWQEFGIDHKLESCKALYQANWNNGWVQYVTVSF